MQPQRNLLLWPTRERDYKQQHWIEMLALPRQNTIMPLLGLLHRVRRFYDFCLSIDCFAIAKRLKQTFSTWTLVPVITKYVRPYFQLLVDKGLIQDMWASSCINLSHYWSVYTIDFVTCTRSGVSITLAKIWKEILKMAKHVVQWYNSIGFLTSTHT